MLDIDVLIPEYHSDVCVRVCGFFKLSDAILDRYGSNVCTLQRNNVKITAKRMNT
jgi:hypothetical protein